MMRFARMAALLLGCTMTACCVMLAAGCDQSGPNGSKMEIPYGTGTDESGAYDTSLFYRNDKTVFNADPQILYVSEEQDETYGGWYYMYTTGQTDVESGRKAGFWVMRSKDMQDWEMCGAVNDGYAIETAADDWMYSRFWAPECYYDAGSDRYWLYFTASSKVGEGDAVNYSSASSEALRTYIGIAVSETPVGPFTLWEGENADGEQLGKDEPQINFARKLGMEQEFPVIDVHLFTDDDGKMYMYFVEHVYLTEPSAATSANICVVEMKDHVTPDYSTLRVIAMPGYRTVTGTAGDYSSFVGSGEFSTDQGAYTDDEGGINEGPFMLKHDGKYYLTYSQDGYTSRYYSVWQAVSDSPFGPFEKIDKADGGMVLGASYENDFMTGTAHHSFIRTGDEYFILYHAHASALDFDDCPYRAVAMDRIAFVDGGNGYDVIYANGPTASLQYLPAQISGYSNIADEAEITVSGGSGTQYLSDGIFATQPEYSAWEFSAEGAVTITLRFDTPRTVKGIMVYNSRSYSKAFAKLDAVYLRLAETPDWFGGKTADYAVLRDVPFPASCYNEPEGIMRPGGSSTAVFEELKVTEIVISVSEKLAAGAEYGGTINISDIVVLGV